MASPYHLVKFNPPEKGVYLHVSGEYTLSDRPVRQIMYWPVVRSQGWIPCWFEAERPELPEKDQYCKHCSQHRDGLIHQIADGSALELSRLDGGGYLGQMRGGGNQYRVWIDPSSPAVRIFEQAIPCPKVRGGIQTRWNGSRGYWEKYLQAKGWIKA